MASTCSTSLVPMPKASAPNAPWVEVWLSPQTMVMPGWVRPSSGPMTWTMPWRSARARSSGMPNSAQFFSSWSQLAVGLLIDDRDAALLGPGVVGVE